MMLPDYLESDNTGVVLKFELFNYLVILLFTSSSQWDIVDCVWDGVLHESVMRMLCIAIANLLLPTRLVMTPAPSIKLCAIAGILHSHAQVIISY